jgi:uncharacterized protein YndB with AHSA1/START domain
MNDLQLTHIPSVKVGMLIRTPPGDVFEAIVDPAITTKFWFTKSTGKLSPGADLRWDWEMYGASARVSVKELEKNSRVVIDWTDDEKTTTVDFRFIPWEDDATYVEVTETGLSGVSCSSRALSAQRAIVNPPVEPATRETIIRLTVVLDRYPEGLEV